MGFSEGLAAQLSLPQGMVGLLLGGAMDIANRVPTRLALDLLAPQDGERILDAGCGTGAALVGLLRRADVRAVGIDPSVTMLEAATRRLRGRALLIPGTVERAALAPASFDGALLLNVLYFTDWQGRMAAAIYRALRPGGRLVAYVTHRQTMSGWRFAQAGKHRLFDRQELASALVAGGFVPERIWVQEVPVTRSIRGLLVRAVR
ncbi:methyltransferase type 11 [Erythrobacter sp. SG61-1L]|uniref:class I SAM-dependent methyltransferase n=1 Tax=Erythrobacter sp. SG61-1L TaxID=1603897 RepID=UPI0006D6F481|nr:class I SAM-dependent methyltransferase [Erythrobacter sp. SG61-1L]KPL68462.1 methyltransferase type 11 [Erythrobacter sp. SG61-1L]